MQQTATNPYLRTRVMTASPQQLRLMLFDGAIKFCRQGRDALERRDYEGVYNSLSRAQKIVLELNTSLNHQIDPDLCAKLSALYTFIYRRLVDANLNQGIEAVDEALDLLEHERETWRMLIEQLNGGENDQAAASEPSEPAAAPSASDAPAASGPTGPANPTAPAAGDTATAHHLSVQG
jgi:flagellar protein FliS